MKNKIKNAVLCIGIFYMAIILVLTLITYCNMVTKIELSSNDEYVEEINSYKERIDSLNDSSCKSILGDFINKVDKDINKKELDLRGSYLEITNEAGILNYYSEATDKCTSLTKEIMSEAKMPLKFITASIQMDDIINEYLYQYELKLFDIRMRELNEVSLISVKNNIKIQNELQIISDLISIIDWGKEV